MAPMRPWPLLVTLVLGCSPPPSAKAPAVSKQASVSEAERRHVSECARGIVARADVVRVGQSRYRGRPALAVVLSSPHDDLVDAYYGDGPGCDLVALVGGPLDAEVRPGPPFRSLAEAQRAALSTRGGVVTSWALERNHDESEGQWAYRFDVDAEGRLQAVFIDALSARPLRAEARSAPPSPEPRAPEPAPPADARAAPKKQPPAPNEAIDPWKNHTPDTPSTSPPSSVPPRGRREPTLSPPPATPLTVPPKQRPTGRGELIDPWRH